MKKWIVILCTTFLMNSLSAQVSYKPNTIKVNGVAERYIDPNEIHLVVQLRDNYSKKYNRTMEQSRAAFMSICDEVGIEKEDIDMSNSQRHLITQKVSFWRKKSSVLRASEYYDIKFTDMSKMIRFIDSMDQPYISSIRFGEQTHSNIATFRKEVKEEATRAAVKKAKYLAQAADQSVKKVIYIEEVSTNVFSSKDRFANSISYHKKTGNAQFNVGLQPIKLRYEVQVISEIN